MSRPETVFAIYEGIDPLRVDAARAMVGRFCMADLADWTQKHTVTDELASQRFRMLVDRGEDPTRAIVIGGEHGNGLDALGSIARARVVRSMVDPSASLILQPNTSLGQPNTNFSRDERRTLRRGSASPLIDRIRKTLGEAGDPDKITAYGPSLGGVTMLALGAHPDMPPVATAVIETPNVVNRSYAGVAKDFIGAGANLKANILTNFGTRDVLGEELVADLSVGG